VMATLSEYDAFCEDNWWHDNYWGDCHCPKCEKIFGRNRLGILLTQVRDELIHEYIGRTKDEQRTETPVSEKD
jgi:hypothetical protein